MVHIKRPPFAGCITTQNQTKQFFTIENLKQFIGSHEFENAFEALKTLMNRVYQTDFMICFQGVLTRKLTRDLSANGLDFVRGKPVTRPMPLLFGCSQIAFYVPGAFYGLPFYAPAALVSQAFFQ